MQVRGRFATFSVAMAVSMAGFAVPSSLARAETGKAAAPASTASSSAKSLAVAPLTGKKWAELSAAQQSILKPLQADWNNIGPQRQSKWLEMARIYPEKTPAQQQAMQERMAEWVRMTPAERANARLNFTQAQQATQSLTPEEKRAKWEAYQALSPEEKQRLAQSKPALPNGAAVTSKPVAPRKLATVPTPAASSAAGSNTAPSKRIDAAPDRVNRQTLLPQSASSSASAAR